MHHFLEVFLPLFVAIDAVGLVPVFLGVTSNMKEPQRRNVGVVAVICATLICLSFMFIGNQLFGFLGIHTSHFMVAGGIILLVLAVLDIVIMGKPAMAPEQMVGVVPLGMPLIAGPATLSTLLVLSADPRHGFAWTTLGLAVNLLILLVCLMLSSAAARWLGLNTLRAMSKLVMILLAAIAVRFIADGVAMLVQGK